MILTEKGDAIAISDLVHCHTCPVRYYFDRNEPVTESDRYAVCKQLSYHLGTPLDSGVIWNEVSTVRPNIDPLLRSFLDSCISACNGTAWNPATQHDVRVVSEKYGIVGMVDRIAADGAFSIIRASGALPYGTYHADRLRIAGCAICLHEMTGKEGDGGFVEYIPEGVSRFHTVQPRDRRQLLATLHKVKSIREGEVPHQPLNAPCARCKYKQRCESSGGRRLSDLM
jgi:CRISPR-associated exonuclease Cas4